MLQTGEIVRSLRKSFPMICHYGIVCYYKGVPYILHHPIGQTPKMEPADKFFSSRIYDKSITVVPVDEEYLLNKFQSMRDVAFDISDSNCEDFVNNIVGEKIVSGAKTDLAVTCSTILVYLLKFI